MSESASQFPWEKLKAETLRTVCKDLGISQTRHPRAEELHAVFREIESSGLEQVILRQAAQPAPRPSRRATQQVQRKASHGPRTRKQAGPAQAQGNLNMQPRRSGRQPQLSVKRRESLQSTGVSKPQRPTARRHRRNVNLAAKKAQFEGVELPSRRQPVDDKQVEEQNALEVINTQEEPRTFAQLSAEADEGVNLGVQGEAGASKD